MINMKSWYLAILAWVILFILVSGCSGQEEKGGDIVNTGDHSWPRLFDIANLSSYEYGMINGTTGMLERQLKVWYGEDPYVHIDLKNVSGDAPVKVTNVNISWLYINRRYESKIYTNEQNGSVIYLEFWQMINGKPYSLAPVWWGNPARENPWIVRSEEGDLSALFDDWMGPSMYVSGFDFVEYNGSTYYCSVYKSYNDSTIRAWRNASFPVPLKMVVNIGNSSIIKGLWTFELAGWS
jgi:hypothetical protein